MKKIAALASASLYVTVGMINLAMLGSTPLIATEQPWALVLLWPLYWMR